MEGPFRRETYSLRPTGAAARLPLPRPVLRRLLRAGRLRVGSRVLLLGGRSGELADCFAWLGISAVSHPALARGEQPATAGDCEALIWFPDQTEAEQDLSRVAGVANMLDSVGVVLTVLHAPPETIAAIAEQWNRAPLARGRSVVRHTFRTFSPRELFRRCNPRKTAHAIIACPLNQDRASRSRRAA